VLLIAIVLSAPSVLPQRADMLMPEESVAKGKQILSDLINALGGAGYSQVRESKCQGRRALFGHNGALTGYIDFIDYRRYPDTDRTEYIGKGRNTILQSLIGIDGLDFAHGGVVITLFDKRTNISRDTHGQIRSVFGEVLFKTKISKNVRLEESPAYKETILTFAPKSPGAVEYKKLAAEVVQRVEESRVARHAEDAA
jgi:hypothetical protein